MVCSRYIFVKTLEKCNNSDDDDNNNNNNNGYSGILIRVNIKTTHSYLCTGSETFTTLTANSKKNQRVNLRQTLLRGAFEERNPHKQHYSTTALYVYDTPTSYTFTSFP